MNIYKLKPHPTTYASRHSVTTKDFKMVKPESVETP